MRTIQRTLTARIVLLGLLATTSIAIGSQQAWAVELLTPRSGAKVIGRNPETHLVLRQAKTEEPSWVMIEKSGASLAAGVSMVEGKDMYLHFRLPLEQGRNRFVILPAGLPAEVHFQQIRSELNPRAIDKEVYLFHEGGRLPESCASCHDLVETETNKLLGFEKQVACDACHQNLVEKGPWQHSTAVNQQCLSCHQQAIKWKIGFPAAKTKDLCLTCHTGKRDWYSKKFIHGPMALAGCTLCHSPHSGNYRYQLWAEGSLRLCITCHVDKENLVSEQERLPYVHGIVFGKGCVACHDPHATDQQFMLRKPINDLCVSCHPRLAGVTRGHPVARHPLSGPTEHRREGRKLTCVGCHDPHGSAYQHLLVDTKLGGRLCRGCHRR